MTGIIVILMLTQLSNVDLRKSRVRRSLTGAKTLQRFNFLTIQRVRST